MGSKATTAMRSLEALLAGKSVEWPRGARGTSLVPSQLGAARAFEARVPMLRIVAPARREAAPSWHLMVHLTGRGLYRMAGREVEQRPGTVVLADGRAEGAVEHPDGAHVVSWVLPDRLIAPYLPARPDAVAEVPGGVGSLLAGHAVALARGADRVEPGMADALVAHLAALTGLALATGRADDDRARPSHMALMRQRCLGLVEARFRDPDLTAATAAKALGMSRRWLHALLRDGGTSFSERLRERRLAEAMRLLRDPSAPLSVTEIGFRVGFNDLATFHRRFRCRYGMTPGQARIAR